MDENYEIYRLTKNLARTKVKKCERCPEDAVMELNGIWFCPSCGLKEIKILRDEDIISLNGIEREEELVGIGMEDEF